VTDAPHLPVLLAPVLAALVPAQRTPPARVIDGTVGAGGHAAALLEAGAGALLGCDLDPAAIALATTRLAPFADRAVVVQCSYAEMAAAAADHGWGDGVDAILLDLGVSSMQFDTPERGFAFRYDAPLDMRFDPQSGQLTAADLLNTLEAAALADLIYEYGEERASRRIAHAVIAARPVTTTSQLAQIVSRVVPRRGDDKIHPATRTFQALRIAVNDELTTVRAALPAALALLRPGGRLAVISFHSLEDRIVKATFKRAAADCICPPQFPVCVCDHRAAVTLVTRKPIEAAAAEAAGNPRARSAKLRVVEKR